jgi:ribosome biogenesis protein Nip4
MELIDQFAKRAGVSDFFLDSGMIVEEKGRYFFLSQKLAAKVQKDFFYAGMYLGKAKAGKFFPSFNLLRRLSTSGARSVIVDRKAAWLFVCGRDVFAKSIETLRGETRKGEIVLVLNDRLDCLGFGKALINLDSIAEGNQVAIQNISDIGDFLRRER